MRKSDNFKYSEKEALSILTRLCSKEEKCLADVRERLYKWRFSANEADRMVAFLIKEKYIDENRYVSYYANDKMRFNKWGRLKIAYSLKQKHIPEEIIYHALDNIDQEQYISILKNELGKKLKTLKKESLLKLREKLYRFAASRGFESDLIRMAIVDILS